MAFDTSILDEIIFQHRIRTNSELVSRLNSLGPPEKGKSTAAQLVSAIETR